MPQNQVEVGLAGALPGTAEILDLFDPGHASEQHEPTPGESMMATAQMVAMTQQSGQMAQENAHTIQELQGSLQVQQADIMHSMGQSAQPIDQAFGVDYGHMDGGYE